MKKTKVVPKDHTRSLELIMRDNPNMTAKEMLAEQAYDKACYELWVANKHKNELALINDINTNGGYYKGRFGLDQRFYYNVTNARLEADRIVADIEKIIVFLGSLGGVVSKGEVRIEKSNKTYQDLDKYGIDEYERTNKYEYEQVNEYLFGIAKFWK